MSLNQSVPFSISLGRDLAAAAERLRRSTVEVQAAGHGKGSGVVWRSDGLIVTNAHVATSTELSVLLSDGRTQQAHLLYRDPQCDLAFLQIPARALPAVETRDASTLRTGELLLAIGNPFGTSGALATGIVSQAPKPAAVLMRADIRLAPGNSGGPLADAHGRVVGINSMIIDGFGIAVTTATVNRLLAVDRPRDTDARAQRAGATIGLANLAQDAA